MFRRNTVFIVGAGASRELGLPTGAELSAQIADMCDIGINRFGNGINPKSESILNDLKHGASGDRERVNGWLGAMLEIRRALPFKDSIDAVIDQYHDWPEIAEVGKYMIAKLVLRAERLSHLGMAFGQPDTRNVARDTWIHTFARMLFEGLRRQNLDTIGSNISVVCFNYDRCIERYLNFALSETYGLDEAEAREVSGKVRIVHAYGSLGALYDDDNPLHRSAAVEFGDIEADAWRVAENLKTFSESVDSATDDTIKSIVLNATQYVYLGLSFGRQNMELLSTDAGVNGMVPERSAFASGKGQYEQGRVAVCGLIKKTYSKTSTVLEYNQTKLEIDSTAKQVLDLHWHNILR